MLVLSRKSDQKIVIGSGIVLTVLAVKGNRVTLGIEAPRNVQIRRSELAESGSHGLEASDMIPAGCLSIGEEGIEAFVAS